MTTYRARLALLGIAAAPLLAAGCSGRTGSPPAASGLSSGPGTPAASSASPAPTGSTTKTSPGAGAQRTDLAEGRHAARTTRVDPAVRRVTVDVVEIFFGEAANKAAREDHAPEVPPPNDYWIRNANPRLRTLSVVAGARITVNVHGAAESGSATKDIPKTLAQLAALDHLDNGVFWLTITDGQVSRIAEQYLP